MLILYELIFPGLERGISVNHRINTVWKNRFYHKCLTAVIFGANINYFEFLSFDITIYFGFQVNVWFLMIESFQ